jgi:hypothetical protein
MTPAVDKRALRILQNTYWSPAGWKSASEQHPSDEDFAYAKSRGLMFDAIELTHSDAVARLLLAVASTNRRRVADAFLASLSTRRLEWRSALGSYAVFQHMSAHTPQATERICTECGLYLHTTAHDFNVLNFERYKWGGIRHDQVEYALLDLELFTGIEPPQPVPEDLAIFRDLVRAISEAGPTVTSAKLQSHLAPMLKSNKAERDVLVAILGYCGILGTAEHPGYSDEFVPNQRRRLPDRHFVDMSYPACWWSGVTGLNQAKLTEYFGHVPRDEA